MFIDFLKLSYAKIASSTFTEEACVLLKGLGGRKTQREKEIRRFGKLAMSSYLMNCKRFK